MFSTAARIQASTRRHPAPFGETARHRFNRQMLLVRVECDPWVQVSEIPWGRFEIASRRLWGQGARFGVIAEISCTFRETGLSFSQRAPGRHHQSRRREDRAGTDRAGTAGASRRRRGGGVRSTSREQQLRGCQRVAAKIKKILIALGIGLKLEDFLPPPAEPRKALRLAVPLLIPGSEPSCHSSGSRSSFRRSGGLTLDLVMNGTSPARRL